MENTCKNCGNLIFDKMVICNSCIEELTIKKRTDLKKKKERTRKQSEEWKKEWDTVEGNWFLEKFSITNTYFGAILYHSLILLSLFIVMFFGPYLFVYFLRIFEDFFSFIEIFFEGFREVAGTPFIVISTIGLIIIIIRYSLRLIYFITNRKKKNQ